MKEGGGRAKYKMCVRLCAGEEATWVHLNPPTALHASSTDGSWVQIPVRKGRLCGRRSVAPASLTGPGRPG